MGDNTSETTIHILRNIQARLGKIEQRLEEQAADISELRREMRERHDNLILIFGKR
jgi:hypothetical protein